MNKVSFRILVTACIAAALFIIAAWWIFHGNFVNLKFFTPAFVRETVLSYGHWSVLVYILIYVFNTILVFPPNAPISLSAGLIFGHLGGAVIILVSAAIGTSAAFFIGRSVERKFLDQLLQGKWKGFSEKLEKNGFMTVLFLRLIPIVPFEILNYICGLSRISYKDFIAGTLLGMIPGAVVTAYFGGALGDINSLADLFSPRILAAGAVLILFVVIPAGYIFFRSAAHRDHVDH